MSRIILTTEQVQAITAVGGPVEVAGPGGQPLGSLRLFTSEERVALERYKREAGKRGSSIPGHRVQAFLHTLHDLADQGRLDEAAVQDLLRRTQADEAR
jgi:hypothetical protein